MIIIPEKDNALFCSESTCTGDLFVNLPPVVSFSAGRVKVNLNRGGFPCTATCEFPSIQATEIHQLCQNQGTTGNSRVRVEHKTTAYKIG